MLKLNGYSDPLSIRPGETIRFFVSGEDIAHYDARIVRVYCGDTHPDGPGPRYDHIPSSIDGRYPARFQPIHAGSWGHVALPGDALTQCAILELSILVYPTLIDGGERGIAAIGENGPRITMDADGYAVAAIGSSRLRAPKPLLLRRWQRIEAIFDRDDGRLELNVNDTAVSAVMHGSDFAGDFLLAALPGPCGHFDGRLEAPQMLAQCDGKKRLIARWDFSLDIASTHLTDTGPNGYHGCLHNLPTRAVRGSIWDGSEMCWRHQPDHYAAIHFHSDDLYDVGWQEDFAWQVPKGLRSGVYAAELTAGEHVERLVFFVRAEAGVSEAKLAFLVSTATYMAYANDHCALLGANPEMLAGRVIELQPHDVFLSEHFEYGLSLYDSHADGSGVCYSSRKRPILNMRPDRLSWHGGQGAGLWGIAADLHIIDWLDKHNIACDIVTDEDLHREGERALAPYNVLVTGTHPEYHSTSMLDGIQDFLDKGGRMAYLGGNGFYWRIAFHPELAGVIEVRRTEDGTRSWASEPGEYYQAFDGEYGGLWRRAGRPPQALAGVGFIGQGFERSRPYRRTAESFDPRVAFLFQGVDGDLIGDHGLIGGGAAGLELDHCDPLLGTPENALVLARSEGHSDGYLLANEEILVNRPNVGGEQWPQLCAELTFFETPTGGAVFSTGSIAWAGSLATHCGNNCISKITENAIQRFLDPTPFTVSALRR